jgi:hypothetical protein
MPLYYTLAMWPCWAATAPLELNLLIEATTCACPVVMDPHLQFADAADQTEGGDFAARLNMTADLEAAHLAETTRRTKLAPLGRTDPLCRQQWRDSAHRGGIKRCWDVLKFNLQVKFEIDNGVGSSV